MNLAIILLMPFLTAVAVLLVAPLLSPRHMFFAVRVAPGFRSTEPAKKALRQYQVAVGAMAVVGIAWILLWPSLFAAKVIPPILLAFAAIVSGVRNHRKIRAFQVSPPTVANVALTTEPDRVPNFFWIALIPPAMLLATALYLRLHWDAIPLRYPIHWGAGGQPNGWSIRSIRGVYGPLIFSAMWMSWLIAMAFVTWNYSRRSPMRAAMAKVMIAVEVLFGLIGPSVSLSALYKPNPGVFAVGIIIATVSTIFISMAAFNEASAVSGNAAGPLNSAFSCYDRNDPALLLPRSDGLGYVPNFAHPAAWILTLAPIALVIVSMKFIF